MTLPGRRPFWLLRFCTFILLLRRASSAGHIDLTIRQLMLRRAPTGCCSNGSDCRPPSTTLTSDAIVFPHPGHHPPNNNLCPLNFRLCIDIVADLSSSSSNSNLTSAATVERRTRDKECLVVARNFSLAVRNARPFDAADQTFVVDAPLPAQRFDFTSTAIAASNISVQLAVWSGGNSKLLLFTRFYKPLPTNSQIPIPFKYVNFGNAFIYELQTSCSVGFTGPGCATFCEPPQANDHYICTAAGMQCLMGWGGPRCSQPQCPLNCANGGRCVWPGLCECPRGWTGPQCEKCVPRMGCQHGYCTDEPGKCICLPNWTGPDCNLLVDKCLEGPCKNGGRCTTDGAHGNFFRCMCTEEFTGTDCSIPYANCRNASCGHNQQCVPLEFSYSCVCLPGFGGPACRLRIPQRHDTMNGSLATHFRDGNGHGASHLYSRTSFVDHQHQRDWSSEFTVLKALLGVCVLLVCVVVAIQCCDKFCCHFWHKSAVVGATIPTLPSDGYDDGELASVSCSSTSHYDANDVSRQKAATELLKRNKLRAELEAVNGLRWGSSSTGPGEGELEEDSGLDSVHSVSTLFYHPNNSANCRFSRLPPSSPNIGNHHHHHLHPQIDHWPINGTPPPSYAESVRTTATRMALSHPNSAPSTSQSVTAPSTTTMAISSREAFV